MIKIWFVAADGEQIGPLSVPEVRKLRRQGRVTETTYVWRDGMDNWMPIESVGELGWIVSLEIQDTPDTTDTPESPAPEQNTDIPADTKQENIDATAATVRVDYKKRAEVSLADGFGKSRDIIKLKRPGGKGILIVVCLVVAIVAASFLIKSVLNSRGPDKTGHVKKADFDIMKCVRECVSNNGNDTVDGYERCGQACEEESIADALAQADGDETAGDSKADGRSAEAGFPVEYIGGKLQWEGAVVILYGDSEDIEPMEIDCGASVVRAAWDEKLLLVELNDSSKNDTAKSDTGNIIRYYADFNNFRDVPAPAPASE